MTGGYLKPSEQTHCDGKGLCHICLGENSRPSFVFFIEPDSLPALHRTLSLIFSIYSRCHCACIPNDLLPLSLQNSGRLR